MFAGDRVMDFAQQFGIKLWHSMPYYAQAHGKAEAIKDHYQIDQKEHRR